MGIPATPFTLSAIERVACWYERNYLLYIYSSRLGLCPFHGNDRSMSRLVEDNAVIDSV